MHSQARYNNYCFIRAVDILIFIRVLHYVNSECIRYSWHIEYTYPVRLVARSRPARSIPRVDRAAAFNVTGRKTSATLSVLFRFAHKSARQESSKFYSDLRNASSLSLTKYYCINCHCSTVTMLIKLSSYVTWSTSETVASVQLPSNVDVILWRQCSCSI